MFSREAKILLALLFLLAALVVYRAATREEPKRVKELTYKPGARGQGPVGEVRELPLQEEAKIKAEKRQYRGVIRNPFQPLYPPPPPSPVTALKPLPPPVPTPFPIITARGPSPAQIESGRIKFLGFLQKEGDRKVFLSKEKEVFIVKRGDSIGIFQVGEISDNSVTLIARDTKEEFKLIIEEVKPTKPVPGVRR